MKTGSRQLNYAIHLYVSYGFAALGEFINRTLTERGFRSEALYIGMCKRVMKDAAATSQVG